MAAAARSSAPVRAWLWPTWRCTALLAVTWLLAGQAPAQVAVRQDGLFISVRNPIDSDLINNIKAKTRRALERKDRPIRTIVFDFNPGQGTSHPSATKEYGVCQELADFLLSNEVQNVTTVAFVHGEVSGHTVLPVLALESTGFFTNRAALQKQDRIVRGSRPGAEPLPGRHLEDAGSQCRGGRRHLGRTRRSLVDR